MKTCSKCGFEGEDELFVRRNWSICKKCSKVKALARLVDQYGGCCNIKLNINIEMEYQKIINSNIKHKLRQKQQAENELIESQIKYDSMPREEKENICKNSLIDELKNLREVKYYLWTQTPSGNLVYTKRIAKGRKLGHEPINEWFEGAEAHHLRYSKTHEKQDNNITIYAPKELHKSIAHNGNTGKNMKEINMLLLKWYLDTTPAEERHPKAVALYLNYCTLPEPEWSRDKT